MSKPPAAPYPPDLADDEPPVAAELGDLVLAPCGQPVSQVPYRAQRWSALRV